MKKKWYHSKMLWVNGIALVGVVAQLTTGKEILDPEAQAVILAFINLVLRVVTNQGIEFGEGDV